MCTWTIPRCQQLIQEGILCFQEGDALVDSTASCQIMSLKSQKCSVYFWREDSTLGERGVRQKTVQKCLVWLPEVSISNQNQLCYIEFI